MSDYHILTTQPSGNKVRVQAAFHYPVPDQDNDAGVNYRTALSQYLAQNPDVVWTQVPWLEANFVQEYNDIQAGAVFEHVETIPISQSWTPAQKQAKAFSYG